MLIPREGFDGTEADIPEFDIDDDDVLFDVEDWDYIVEELDEIGEEIGVDMVAFLLWAIDPEDFVFGRR